MYVKPTVRKVPSKEIETLLTPQEHKLLFSPIPKKSKNIIFSRLKNRITKVCLITPGGRKYTRFLYSKNLCIYLNGDNIVETTKR